LAKEGKGMTTTDSPSQDDIPSAPWRLTGDAIAFFGGPMTLQMLVHYTGSPVGPYDEHALATVNLRGPHVFQMSVNSEASRRGGRSIWGFPKVLETLAWHQKKGRVVFERENQQFRVRGVGPKFPVALVFWTAQRKGGRWVRVPGKIKGKAQLAWRGRQLACWLHNFEMKIGEPY
jgi:hypothetical protein